MGGRMSGEGKQSGTSRKEAARVATTAAWRRRGEAPRNAAADAHPRLMREAAIRVCSMPIQGIRRNPAAKEPAIPPSVLAKKISPIRRPRRDRSRA